MKSFIINHIGNYDDFVLDTIENHKEWYGKNDKVDLLRVHFYDLIDEDGEILGFFGVSYWQHVDFKECVICYVFIKEEHRKNGLFKKIIKFVKDKNTEYELIVIGATWVNKLANSIYSKHFKFYGKDYLQKGNWYCIKDRRK